MIEVTFAQLQAWLAMFLWPFMRVGAFVMAAPILGHTALPARIKIGLTAILTFAIAATQPTMPDIPIFSWAGFGIMVEQVIIGVGLALCMLIVVTVVQVAGEFIGLQMGLAFASFFSPATDSNTMILSQWLYIITLLLFVTLDGHLLMIRVLADTFVTLPIGVAGMNTGAFEMLARFSSIFFASGLLLALPLVASLLILNLTLGILNRAAPQFTVFSVGFPMSLAGGIVLLTVLMTDLAGFLESLFLRGLQMMQQFAVALGA